MINSEITTINIVVALIGPRVRVTEGRSFFVHYMEKMGDASFSNTKQL